MSWIKIPISDTVGPPGLDAWHRVAFLEKWCMVTLGPHGVLWKYKIPNRSAWPVFCFAQEQDAFLFRMTHGA